MNASIRHAVRSVWESRLGFDVHRARDVEAPRLQGRTLVAVVRVDGAPRTAVILECPAALARRAAGRLRGVPPEAVSIEEAEDALSELAVLTSAWLMPALKTSSPHARIVDEGDERPRRAEPRREAFDCDGQVFFVTLAG